MNAASQLIHALRGPLVLIAAGFLIQIDYLGIYRFSATWPILLIVFGVITLLEKLAQPPRADRYPAPPSSLPPRGGSAI